MVKCLRPGRGSTPVEMDFYRERKTNYCSILYNHYLVYEKGYCTIKLHVGPYYINQAFKRKSLNVSPVGNHVLHGIRYTPS